MIISRIYTGDDEQSHFEEIDVSMEDASWGQMSALLQTEGMRFRQTPSSGAMDFHNAPRRQFLVNLSGEAEIETGDGTKKRFGPGSILLADDTTGQGHITREVGGGRSGLVVPVPDDFDVDSIRG